MRDIFKFEKLAKYPHMKPADVLIWEKFIDKYPFAYESVQYDFSVGDPPPFNPLMPDGEDLNQDALYRLKIDVIGHSGNAVDIIELKPKAGPSSLGQVRSYRHLYIRDEEPEEEPQAVVITDTLMPNMEYMAKAESVKLIIVD